jgi:acetyl esterase/lipase
LASEQLAQLIETLKAAPVAPEGASIQEIRSGFEQMGAMFPLPDDVTLEKVTANGVPAEWVSAPGARTDGAVLYLHGGGYVIGSVNTHRELVSRISRSSGLRALSLDYRLAPENPFPAAVDDSVAGYQYLLNQGIAPERIAVAGDSAGGGLTIATLVALKERGLPQPAAAVPMSPWVDLEGIGDSMTSKDAEDPMVHKDALLPMAEAYLGGANPRTPLAAPLYADLSGIAPMLIQVGTAETLLDDSTRIAEKARSQGVSVVLEPWQDMIHVFQLFANMLPEGQQAIDRIGEFIRERVK